MKERILVVDDESDIREAVRMLLERAGFEVLEASNGEEALKQVRQGSPHLILLDFIMPRMNGEEVCRILKKDTLLRHLPIIILTNVDEMANKLGGIEFGADDYMVKPTAPDELVARIRLILERTSNALDANPLTRLPGNASIEREIQRRFKEGKLFAVCYADLDHFKEYNDVYGFQKGDELIKATARILLSAMREEDTASDFLGHIGGDDFILITAPEASERLSERVVREFAKAAVQFYSKEDQNRGYIETADRRGQVRRFPLLTLSIGIVTNEHRALTHVAEVAQIGAELKSWIKKQGGNRWLKDRRQK